MGRYHYQKGMTLFGSMLTLFMAAFFATLAFKIGPIYTEHATVKTALESLKSQPDLASNSRESIAELLKKRLEINNVNVVKRENIEVAKRGDYVKVEVVYDHTVPLFGNLDITAHFDDGFELGDSPE